MSQMIVPPAFRSLPEETLKNGKAVTADLAQAFVGNGAWLYEGYMARPVPGANMRTNRCQFDHTGKGRGRRLPVIVNQNRGVFQSAPDFGSPIIVAGDGKDVPVPAVVNDFHTGTAIEADAGWNWRKAIAQPFVPHDYAVFLRTRVQVRQTAGSDPARLYAAVYADAEGAHMIGRGTDQWVDQPTWTVVELVMGLQEVPYIRGALPSTPWYWGLRLWAPPETVIEIQDGELTGPCLAISSV